MFITFEGIDYSGKSTQAKLLFDYFKSKKKKAVLIREPGGTKISEKIRKILLDKDHHEMLPETEFLLFSAARAQLVSQMIRLNLKRKKIVICDRYYDSSTAYQGYGGKLDLKNIDAVNMFATGGLKPDITFFIDLPPKFSFPRAGKNRDRIENRKLAFYNRVYRGFKEIVKKEKQRFIAVDGKKSIQDIHKEVVGILNLKFRF